MPELWPGPWCSRLLPFGHCFLDPGAGPYIVYMLQEIDILEDWTAIKKVGLVQGPTPDARSALQAPTLAFLRSLASLPATHLLLPRAALGEGASSLVGLFLVPGQVLMGGEKGKVG